MNRLLRVLFIYFIAILYAVNLFAQKKIPKVYSNLLYDTDGTLYYRINEGFIPEHKVKPVYSLDKLQGNPKGTKTGISFNFRNRNFEGTMYYGFIPYGDSKHPYPVYFRNQANIIKGETHIDILNSMSGKYDMIAWQKKGRGTLGYRILNAKGEFIYDGIITFKGKGPFNIDNTIVEGPFINMLSSNSVIISFKTNNKLIAKIIVDNNEFADSRKTLNHEILIDGLQASKKYIYLVELPDSNIQQYSFTTAPLKGDKSEFSFAYCSDSRDGMGGGERSLYGTNYYIMKKIMALTNIRDIRFMQFTGDLIDGYATNKEEIELQYANWKRSIQPFAHYLPVYAAIGNHEVLLNAFVDTNDMFIRIAKFPFDKYSTETVFAENFVNPVNGPESEDGAYYDPDIKNIDFPSYKENVYYYSYANIAVVVLNSDYLYAPDLNQYQQIGGNLHAYIMDNQLKWFSETIQMFENDSLIDHVFVTIHTPAFPNGGHLSDDMWYNGNNDYRPYINGKPVDKGIIERRDEFLDIMINRSQKVVALLTGDEHNYNRLLITNDMPKYPENWNFDKLKLNRNLVQINNGAAGAPYYAQENTPWTKNVSGFTTQNAVVIVHVEGNEVKVEVINPDTLEEVDRFILREE